MYRYIRPTRAGRRARNIFPFNSMNNFENFVNRKWPVGGRGTKADIDNVFKSYTTDTQSHAQNQGKTTRTMMHRNNNYDDGDDNHYNEPNIQMAWSRMQCVSLTLGQLKIIYAICFQHGENQCNCAFETSNIKIYRRWLRHSRSIYIFNCVRSNAATAVNKSNRKFMKQPISYCNHRHHHRWLNIPQSKLQIDRKVLK